MRVIVRNNVIVCGWSPFQKYCRNASSLKKISVFEVTNMPMIIGKVSLNYEITTLRSCHDVTTSMET